MRGRCFHNASTRREMIIMWWQYVKAKSKTRGRRCWRGRISWRWDVEEKMNGEESRWEACFSEADEEEEWTTDLEIFVRDTNRVCGGDDVVEMPKGAKAYTKVKDLWTRCGKKASRGDDERQGGRWESSDAGSFPEADEDEESKRPGVLSLRHQGWSWWWWCHVSVSLEDQKLK